MDAAPHLQQPQLWPITVDWELAFTRPPAHKALAYWRSLLHGRRMPARCELRPRAMKDFLKYVNLVDVLPIAEGEWDYAVSLQSADALEVLGDIKGRRITEVFPSPHAQRWRCCFDLPRKKKAPVRLLTRASTRNKNWLACEVFLAPLGDRDDVTSIFWLTAAWPAGNPAFAQQTRFASQIHSQ
jgi:hypothetical protein